MEYLRKEHGLSQAGLAKELGVSQHTVSTYEKDISNPTLYNLCLLSKFYKISIEAMLTTDLCGNTFNFGMRKTTAREKEYGFFEGITLNVYYKSDRSYENIHCGKIVFDQKYDEEHLFLHGNANTWHNYDCKLVIEGTNTVNVYGTEKTMPRRFQMMLYYPDFRDDTKYLAGLALVTRIDGKKSITSMRVAVTCQEIDVSDERVEKKLVEYLTRKDDVSEGVISVDRKLDDEYREWIRKILARH